MININDEYGYVFNHMFGYKSGFSWRCHYRHLGTTRRHVLVRFDTVAVDCIERHGEWEAVAFPAFTNDLNHGYYLDYKTPIVVRRGTVKEDGRPYYKDEFVDEIVNDVISHTIDCNDKESELAFLLAYLNR